ncbi:MAG: hypothetical protein RL148_2337, partial [Planctomycetota bacterium]
VLAATASGQVPAAPPPQQPKPAAPTPAAAVPVPLGEAATQVLVRAHDEAGHWALRAIVLLSLGRDFHPAGSAALVKALKDKDARMQAYAVEVLRRMDAAAAPEVATRELVDALVDGPLQEKNDFVRDRALEALLLLVPASGARDRNEWREWWRKNELLHVPPAWTPPPAAPRAAGGTVAGSVVEKAFDLRDAGLQVAIVIDSTGSMQQAINAARDAIDDVVALLSGIAPRFEVGLVHYKDFGDMGDGAKLLEPLTKDQKVVRERLAKLVAGGGGDTPERVECGVGIALGKEMGWDRDANRLVLVIGDAPAHEEVLTGLVEMVKRAHDQPFSRAKGPVTGAKVPSKLRPFITSCIATNPAAKPHFEAIAAAGGGACVLLPMAAPNGKDVASAQSKAVQEVVRHVLKLSFGTQYEAQLNLFADVYFTWRDAKAF